MKSGNALLGCAHCGQKALQFPADLDNLKSDDTITCLACGAAAAWADIKPKLLRQAEQLEADVLRNALKGIPGFKLSK